MLHNFKNRFFQLCYLYIFQKVQHKDFAACCKNILHAAKSILHAANRMLHAANGMLHAACCNLQLHFTANFTEV